MNTVAFYCGTFKPFHIGHLNILEKAEKLFNIVVVGRGVNPDKEELKNPCEDPKHIRIFPYSGLTTDFIRERTTRDEVPVLIRGIRNAVDYSYECNQMRIMKEIMPELQFVLISCDTEYEHISSSMIRTLIKLAPNHAQKYIVK